MSKKPSRESIEKTKELIDELFKTNDCKDYVVYEGGGRTVFLINGFAVKMPESTGEEWVDGSVQNLKEAEIYFSTKHNTLVPIYATHRGCLICKEVIGDYVYLEEVTGINSKLEIENMINLELESMNELIQEFNLDENEIRATRNWGYDLDEKRFRCLDYGIATRF